MGTDFAVVMDPDWLKSGDNNHRIDQLSIDKLDSLDVSELFVSYQKLKTEEQQLANCKKDLHSMEMGLRNRLIQEINNKKKAVEELKVEILTLNSTCNEIEQELGLPPHVLKKATDANLISEIPDLEIGKNHLGQALGGDIHNKIQAPKINSPALVDAQVQPALQECIGLLSCSKPEKCRNYEPCLKKYLSAEMRNEILML